VPENFTTIHFCLLCCLKVLPKTKTLHRLLRHLGHCRRNPGLAQQLGAGDIGPQHQVVKFAFGGRQPVSVFARTRGLGLDVERGAAIGIFLDSGRAVAQGVAVDGVGDEIAVIAVDLGLHAQGVGIFLAPVGALAGHKGHTGLG